MFKFFVNKEQIENNKITIIGEDVNHIKNVLRLNKNDKIEIANQNEGKSYECIIEEIEKEKVIVKIENEIKYTTESNLKITLFQGLPKFEKMEFIIEKSTELGISEITPVEMKRCVVKFDEKTKQKKIERWQKIAEVAAKQSKRDIIPTVNSIINIKNIFKNFENYDIVLIANENEKINTLKNELTKIKKENNFKNIAVIVGPEGGIDENEIELLIENGAKSITLGKRILRTETAPIAIIANIMYELDT